MPRSARRPKGEPPKILALLAACSLYPELREGACAACGGSLSGRRTRWCSSACARSWRTNHLWNYARRAARARDKNTCVSCGVSRPAKPTRRRFPAHADYNAACEAYKAVTLEVNHRVPLAGATRAKAGCWHHLANLETLCADCHRPITAAQAAERARVRRAAKLVALPVAA